MRADSLYRLAALRQKACADGVATQCDDGLNRTEAGHVEQIPALSIVVEEVSARELVSNRLEAFVDLMRDRRRAAKGQCRW